MTLKSAPNFKGRTMGTTLLVFAQAAIGIIHSSFGLLMLLSKTSYYNVYTLAFGLAVLILSYELWNGSNLGRYGTITASAFVAIADSLTILNLPSIPGIPKFAAYFETIYCLFVIVYILQTRKIQTQEKPK